MLIRLKTGTQGLASAIAVACGARFLFTKELLPAIMYGVLMEEDSATQVFVMQGNGILSC